MISIRLVCVGSVKEHFYTDAIAEYKKRLSRFCDFSVIEIPETVPRNDSEIKKCLASDSLNIRKHLKGKVIICDIDGVCDDSIKFAKTIEQYSLSASTITFVIGASNGLDEDLKKSADYRLSFGKMTYPHTLMRVILTEQIYRAFTILGKITYHK